MIKAVIFDMDGVIFDSEKCVIECWQIVAQQHGIKNIEDTCTKCLGINATVTKEIFLEIYGQDFPYDEYKAQMRDVFFEKYDEGRLPLKPGITQLLQFLKNNNIKTALATSTRRQSAEKELKYAGLYNYFDKLIYGDMVNKSKPEPDIFLKAIDELSVLPGEAMVIEDSYNGIRAAFAANALPVMVPDLLPATEEMKEKAFKIFKNLNEVEKFLEAEKSQAN